MTIFDDLIKIQSAMPSHIDIILSTECPVWENDSIIGEYDSKIYLLAHRVTVRKLEYYNQQKQACNPTPFFGLTMPHAFGAPIIENEKLVAEILSHFDKREDNPFMLTEEARKWVQDNV